MNVNKNPKLDAFRKRFSKSGYFIIYDTSGKIIIKGKGISKSYRSLTAAYNSIFKGSY